MSNGSLIAIITRYSPTLKEYRGDLANIFNFLTYSYGSSLILPIPVKIFVFTSEGNLFKSFMACAVHFTK
jgi:hypothetical protein